MHVFVRAAVSGVGGAQHVRIGRHRRRRDVLQQERGQCQRVLQIDKPERRQLGRVVALAVRVQMSRRRRRGIVGCSNGSSSGRRGSRRSSGGGGGSSSSSSGRSSRTTAAATAAGAGRGSSCPFAINHVPGESKGPLPLSTFQVLPPSLLVSRSSRSVDWGRLCRFHRRLLPPTLHRRVPETAARCCRCCCCCCCCWLPVHINGATGMGNYR